MIEFSDWQRFDVYGAENRSGVTGRRFRSLFQVQNYVDNIVFSDWWYERFPRCLSIIVRASQATDLCGSSGPLGGGLFGAFVTLPVDAWFERYVLHELAHCATNHPDESHGEVFTRAYLDLVGGFMSSRHASALERSFRRSGVSIAPDTNGAGR